MRIGRWAYPWYVFVIFPLSQLKDHVKVYGSYGIGMSKDWGRRMGINPILYIHGKSELVKHISGLVMQLSTIKQNYKELDGMGTDIQKYD